MFLCNHASLETLRLTSGVSAWYVCLTMLVPSWGGRLCKQPWRYSCSCDCWSATLGNKDSGDTRGAMALTCGYKSAIGQRLWRIVIRYDLVMLW